MGILLELEKYIYERTDRDVLKDMEAFNLSTGDIDDEGYVTLYHGGVKLPTKLNKGEIFFMTASKEEAEDYKKMRNGEVFEIKVKPEDVSWNQGSYEVEYDKGGKIVDGKIISPVIKKRVGIKSKEEWIDDNRKFVPKYKNVSVGDKLPKTGWVVKQIVYFVNTDRAQFNFGDVDRWYDANSVINYEFGEQSG